jgi:hypothetical protein
VAKSSLIAVAAGVAAALGPTEAAPAAGRVTLEVDRYYDAACYCYRLRFRGAIFPRRAKEYVAVTQRRCGFGFATAVAGASTRADGSWVVRSSLASDSSATYRATWGVSRSKPVTVRPRIPVQLERLARERYRVEVTTADARQNMAGRFVELQRLAAGSWTRVRRTRLNGSPGAIGSYSATVVVRRRGLRVRIAVPEKSAAPCFTTNVTQTFVS